MYTIKRFSKHHQMVPDRDVPGKKTTNDDYMQIAEPYDKPKPKKTKDESKKRDPWKSAKQFEPQDAGARTYLSTDDGCFGRFHYEKQGYGSAQLYKDKTFHKDSKAAQCLRGAPFGSKNAPRRDEFHQHLLQLQWKEQMEKEKKKAKSWGQNKMNESTMKADAEQSKEDIIKKKVLAYDRSKGLVQESNFDNSWKTKTGSWITKKGYGIKKLEKGNMAPSSTMYGNFDLNSIERPKHAKVSVVSEFNSLPSFHISSLG